MVDVAWVRLDVANVSGILPRNAQDLVENGYSDSGGVKTQHVTAGKGPLVILIHGFADSWYTWRAQVPELAKHDQGVAIDQRGENLGDKPEGVERYAMDRLVGEVAAFYRHFGKDKAIDVGQDRGGIVIHAGEERRALVHPPGITRRLPPRPETDDTAGSTRGSVGVFMRRRCKLSGPERSLMIGRVPTRLGEGSP